MNGQRQWVRRDVLTVGSLFAGIGGFDLGLERAGMRTLWFCEQDPFCQRVLAKHWPGVPCYPDVRALVADAGCGSIQRERGSRELADETRGDQGQGDQRERNGNAPSNGCETPNVPVSVPYVDILCGGFPCQDLSYAGKGAGLDGERSGLWSEYARLIRELRPRYVIVENVSALLARGLGRVLGDLAACGYDAEWDCIPASAVGAPHRRDRVWLVAYPGGAGRWQDSTGSYGDEAQDAGGRTEDDHKPGGTGTQWVPAGERNGSAPNTHGEPVEWPPVAWGECGQWSVEPDVGRVANGVPMRVDRLRSLGNSLVPQIAEWIGRRIIEWEDAR